MAQFPGSQFAAGQFAGSQFPGQVGGPEALPGTDPVVPGAAAPGGGPIDDDPILP
jgi:hypothetical protein